jgi:hypothetical protein
VSHHRFGRLVLASAFLGLAALVAASEGGASTLCRTWSANVSEHLDWVCTPHAGDRTVSTERPSLAAACRVMEEHVADLLNQHRRTNDVDDTSFDAALRMFLAGQAACGAERYDDGLRIYGRIPLGRPTSLLR